MEFVDGVNLRQAIQAGGMDPKQALAIVPQICDALQFAHEEGVVHRDVKPENILIDKRGRVKIADFGLAKLLGQAPGDIALTATQQVMGTLRYMAPEQMEGTKGIDHRADIYSLGVVFYELLTGELPIGRFAPPSKKVEIDVRLDEVVLRALEKEPEQRYQHASEVKTDMETIAGSHAQAPVAESVAVLSGPTLLLDETDRAARRYQHFLLLGGMAWIVLGVILALLQMPVLLPISLVLGIGGIALMVAASRNRQQWEIDYLGHSLRFENSVYTSGRLIIDGKTMAAGGVGLSTELSARIPRGLGAGDRIVVKTNAGFLSFRCRIFVEPKVAAAPKPARVPDGGYRQPHVGFAASETPSGALPSVLPDGVAPSPPAAQDAGPTPPSHPPELASRSYTPNHVEPIAHRATVAPYPRSAAPRLAPLAIIGAVVGVLVPAGSLALFIGSELLIESLGREPMGKTWQVLLVSVVAISLIVMTLLGAIAITQIRHSNGKLYGVELAILEAFLCPALTVDFAVFYVLFFLFVFIGNTFLRIHDPSQLRPYKWLIPVAFIVLFAADVLIYRWLSKKLKSPRNVTRSIAL